MHNHIDKTKYYNFFLLKVFFDTLCKSNSQGISFSFPALLDLLKEKKKEKEQRSLIYDLSHDVLFNSPYIMSLSAPRGVDKA
jgi:hypothetical protein